MTLVFASTFCYIGLGTGHPYEQIMTKIVKP
jgi:hypothetical protein